MQKRDEELRRSIVEAFKNVPSCYPHGPAPTLKDIRKSLARLFALRDRLARLRKAETPSS